MPSLTDRNIEIFRSFVQGDDVKSLAERFCISEGRIYKIIARERSARPSTQRAGGLSWRTANLVKSITGVDPSDPEARRILAETDIAKVRHVGAKTHREISDWLKQ